ncbi:unnamed protein product [Withania somnifera]
MDDQLDKLYQAFNTYKKKRSIDDIDPKDFMDKYFAQNDYDAESTIMQISRDFEAFERLELEKMVDEMDSGDGSGGGQLISGTIIGSSNFDHLYNDAQSSTIMQISKDFEAFERTKLTLAIKTSVDFNDNMNQLGEDVDETESMIEEMALQYTICNAHPSYNAFGCYNNVYEGHGGGFGQLVSDIANDSSCPVIRYFFCGQTKNVAEANRRKRQKRKYRGVVMSEEQRLLNMAKQKIKNREVAARTYAMRQAHEAYLESQHKELLKQNNFLKKMVTFLEEHKRVDVPLEPLRRTISGPMLI